MKYGFGFGFGIGYGSPRFSVPSQVTGLSVAVVSDVALTPSWTAPSNGGSPITGYFIEYKIGAGAWGTLVADTGNTNTSYPHTGLTTNTLYTYRVSAINAIGTGLTSAEASATTYDTDMVAMVGAYTDIPNIYYSGINAFYVSHKANGLFTKMKWATAFFPTMIAENCLINMKDATTPSGAVIGNNGSYYPGIFPTGVGFYAPRSTYINIGLNENELVTVGSGCFVHSTIDNEAQAADFTWGARASGTNGFGIQERGTAAAADKVTTLYHNSTDNQGRMRSNNTTTKGTYINNKRSTTDMEQYKDSTLLLANTGTDSGTIGTIDIYLGCFNSAGVGANVVQATPLSEPCGFINSK